MTPLDNEYHEFVIYFWNGIWPHLRVCQITHRL